MNLYVEMNVNMRDKSGMRKKFMQKYLCLR